MPAKKKEPTYDDVAAQHDAMQDALATHELPALDEALTRAREIVSQRDGAFEAALAAFRAEAEALAKEVEALPQRSKAAREKAREVIQVFGQRPAIGPRPAPGDRLAAARAAVRPAG
ncbi:MAG: hypothetical protein ACQRW7_02970 [Caulobacterales bacterium]|uniref:hypothetical protein n=1 Tax=Glycocaulis sp. TaxID=1969725 RepID=UPI003F9F2709